MRGRLAGGSPDDERSFWLHRCDGFVVEAAGRRVGVVENLRFESSTVEPDEIVVRLGRLPRRRLPVPASAVAGVDPKRRRLVLDERAPAVAPLLPAPPEETAEIPVGGRLGSLAASVPRAALSAVLVLGLSLAALAAGVGLAYLLERSHARTVTSVHVLTVVRTVTAPPLTRTVRERASARTVTVSAPKPATSTAPALATGPALSGGAHGLNDQGYALITHGEFGQAVPLLRVAVERLRGAGPGDPYEGFANYNLGYALLRLGRCADAVPPLRLANALEANPAVDRALAQAQECA
jgi:hypothetical protein